MSKKKMNKKKKLHILLWIVAVLVIAGAAGYTLFIKPMMQQEEAVYRENTAQYGILQNGVTESGTVEFGVTSQVYDLDLSTEDDDDDDDHEHCCHHHHDEDEHDHDHHHHHHDGEECDDPHCGCHHHHHHADEVFTSWGTETVKAYSEAELEHILTALDSGEYGAILRAKGIVAAADGGQWLHYDFVPEEHQVRRGPADYTGRICVIGSQLKEDKLSQLFGL